MSVAERSRAYRERRRIEEADRAAEAERARDASHLADLLARIVVRDADAGGLGHATRSELSRPEGRWAIPYLRAALDRLPPTYFHAAAIKADLDRWEAEAKEEEG